MSWVLVFWEQMGVLSFEANSVEATLHSQYFTTSLNKLDNFTPK
jgi:hypothetical protein